MIKFLKVVNSLTLFDPLYKIVRLILEKSLRHRIINIHLFLILILIDEIDIFLRRFLLKMM